MYNQRKTNLVSIVVSNYNNEKYIEACLDSLINQTYKDIEIIIVDDCSTDKSKYIIEKWISNRKNDEKNKIKFLKMTENTGFSGAVTTGMYLAKGEYIAMQDGDDISKKNRIEIEVNYLKNNKDIKMVGCNYAIFKNYVAEEMLVPNGVLFGKEKIKEEFQNGGSPVSFGTILFRGEIFDEIGGLTRKLEGAEDYEFIAKSVGYGIDNINLPLYLYRKHDKQRSRKYYSGIDYFRDKNNNMSVLLVVDKINISTNTSKMLLVAKNLIENGAKVTIISENMNLSSEFMQLNCKVYNLDFSSINNKDINAKNSLIDKVCEIIKTEKINLIKMNQSSAGRIVIEAGKKCLIPYMISVGNMY